MRHTHRLLIAAVLSCMSAAAAPQGAASAAKPVAMAGEWEHHASVTLYTGKWEIQIDDEKPDGSLAGTLTYWGTRCNARGAAMSGKRAGKKLTLEARLGVCGKGTFDLEEVAAGRYAGNFTVQDTEAGEKKATLALR